LNKVAVCFMFQTNAFFYQKIRKVILVHLIYIYIYIFIYLFIIRIYLQKRL